MSTNVNYHQQVITLWISHYLAQPPINHHFHMLIGGFSTQPTAYQRKRLLQTINSGAEARLSIDGLYMDTGYLQLDTLK